MATMLAFLTTDADLDQAALQRALTTAVSGSFDRISVDACESTNDSVFLVSSGLSGPTDEMDFASAVAQVCSDLAEQMVRDAEGGSRLVRIRVTGAADESAGVALGRSVAASALWRAAVHGADPNWGRVLSALGAVDRDLDLTRVSLTIGSVPVFSQGVPTGAVAEAAREMGGDEFVVGCHVGAADTRVEILTTDLSPEYVTINASGTS
jgi:glutamate N-acetyltransferase/amino-acid N-acetyltransferase